MCMKRSKSGNLHTAAGSVPNAAVEQRLNLVLHEVAEAGQLMRKFSRA